MDTKAALAMPWLLIALLCCCLTGMAQDKASVTVNLEKEIGSMRPE